jgi:hypothetical protein
MIRMPHVHSNISMIAKLGLINSQFYRFLRLCSCKKFFVFQMVSLIVLLKAKGYPLKVLLKRTRGLVLKEKFLFACVTRLEAAYASSQVAHFDFLRKGNIFWSVCQT